MFNKTYINDAFKQIKEQIDDLLEENKALRKENKELKSAHYKDKEIKKMKASVDECDKALKRGFPIWDEWQKKIDKWKDEHDKEHITPTPRKYTHHYSYIFTPSPVGTIGTIRCSCGEEFCFQ